VNVNLSAIGIFGPGSEWFWAMAQFLVLTVTGLAIYRQLRAQGSANALEAQESLLARWESPEMVRVRLAALMHIASGAPGEPPTLGIAGNFFANMAALRAHQHLRPTDSWEMWSAQVQFWWALQVPWIHTYRARNPGAYGEFEELAATMADLDRKEAVPNFEIDDLGSRMDREIRRLIERLRLERDARQGLVPTWPIPEPMPGPEGEAASEAARP
jgi:hypothetical protein